MCGIRMVIRLMGTRFGSFASFVVSLHRRGLSPLVRLQHEIL
jgi:hypothetical protein